MNQQNCEGAPKRKSLASKCTWPANVHALNALCKRATDDNHTPSSQQRPNQVQVESVREGGSVWPGSWPKPSSPPVPDPACFMEMASCWLVPAFVASCKGRGLAGESSHLARAGEKRRCRTSGCQGLGRWRGHDGRRDRPYAGFGLDFMTR